MNIEQIEKNITKVLKKELGHELFRDLEIYPEFLNTVDMFWKENVTLLDLKKLEKILHTPEITVSTHTDNELIVTAENVDFDHFLD